MGIVAKQSARNALVLATGLLLGAINTMFVLPAAFEGYEEGWGLIRVMTSWGTILAQVLALGMPNAMLRFLPQAQGEREGNVLSLIAIVPALAFALAGLASIWMGPDALLALDADKGWLLSGRVGAFLWMAGAYLAMLMLRALLIHRMRTVVVTVIQELWLKGSYLALAVVYLQGWMPFETFFKWFLYSYAAAVFFMLVEAHSAGIQLRKPSFRQDGKPVLEFGLFAFWNVGARTIAKNLDFVMVGALLGLAVVPRYTFAFFIATVVAMPMRAMGPILNSLTSKDVAKHGPEASEASLKQSARVLLSVTSALLVAIWSGMPWLDAVLPEGFQGLEWVVLAVGLTYVLEASGGTAGPILQFSDRYKLALPINLGLVVMTVGFNYAFMAWFGWGIEGAAWATALTGLWNMGWRTTLMWQLFQIHPFTRAWLGIAASAVAIAVAMRGVGSVIDVTDSTWWNLALALGVGGAGGALTLASAWGWGGLPELRQELAKRFSP